MSEIDQILEEEGFRSRPYQDTEGVWTIGHGITHITEEESRAVVMMKLRVLRDRIRGQLHWYDSSPTTVQNVLTHMAYQLGLHGMLQFNKTLSHLVNQDYRAASIEMLISKWAKQTPARAKRLSDRILSLA